MSLKQWTLESLAKFVERLDVLFTQFKLDLERKLSILDMNDRWQVSEEDNVDATYPLETDIYIPATATSIKQVIIRIKLKAFRSYGATTETQPVQVLTSDAGGAVVVTSAVESVNFGSVATLSTVVQDSNTASHGHGIPGGTSLAVYGGGSVTFSTYGGDSHFHEQYTHQHTSNIPDHQHPVTIPEHAHDIAHGIYSDPAAVPTDCTIVINGTDRTNDLVGAATFSADQEGLDVTAYMTPTGYNTIEVTSATIGRIRCTAYVHLYLRGG